MYRVDDHLRTSAHPGPPGAHVWPPSAGALLRLWPWTGSLAAATVVDLIIGAARHFDFGGIEGFSTTNYGWLAFSLVGGVGLAWRMANPPARWWLLLRPLTAPALAFIACFVMVTLMGLLFIPGQPVTKTLTTDAPGRALWLSLLVAVGSCACEALWALIRRARRYRQPNGS